MFYVAETLVQPILQIDVMVLYSDLAMTTLGGITSQQLETIILDSLAGTNQAMINSGISAYINPVFIGLVRFHGSFTVLSKQGNI